MRLSAIIGGLVFWLIVTGCMTTIDKCVNLELGPEGEFRGAAGPGEEAKLDIRGPAAYQSVPVKADPTENAIMQEACNSLFSKSD